ncbi:surfeit locus protein 6 homolog [Nilaparvata lugens]|uniref:surfeit locus protein 6 homolog n=1 Tax=Nilaparvata lugens TaxID=108931 RepID=UPI00193E8D96|nr:surfeit locus protein 6 homolog [Nilaparvata lugens]
MSLATNNNGIMLNKKKLMKILTESYKFVSSFEKYCKFPDQGSRDFNEDDEGDLKFHKEPNQDNQDKPIADVKKRLGGLEELEMKLKEIRGKKLTNIKDIRYKKNLKTRLNKQKKVAAFKQDKETKKQKKMKEKQKRREALESKKEGGGEVSGTGENSTTDDKIIFNKDSKMVFNKIDFTGLGKEKSFKRKRGKVEKDPKQLLENVKKSNSEIKALEESGEAGKAKKLKEKHMWVSALKRAEGGKVKDDVELLKKSVRKQTQIKNQRKKKWEERVHAVEKKKEERQKKRTDNIAARKKEKKKNKIKKSVKKGRIVL